MAVVTGFLPKAKMIYSVSDGATRGRNGGLLDTIAFRNTLGRFATGVCLITVNDAQSGPLALTANSFASVSLDPALVLWSIQRNSECLREYTECAQFGISVLAQDQMALSNHYAKKGAHGIDPAHFSFDDANVPVLSGAVAHFSCDRHVIYDGGDHDIIVGKVRAFSSSDAQPLLFFQGGYGALAAKSD